MANTISKLAKRSINLLLGIGMFTSSVLLIFYDHINLFEILVTLNPYPIYFLGLIFGVERIFFGVTGSSKLFSLFVGGGEYSSLWTFGLFTALIMLGVYVLVYTIAYQGLWLQLLNSFNGLTYLIYSYVLFKAWHT